VAGDAARDLGRNLRDSIAKAERLLKSAEQLCEMGDYDDEMLFEAGCRLGEFRKKVKALQRQ
jgi:hypothetical protein